MMSMLSRNERNFLRAAEEGDLKTIKALTTAKKEGEEPLISIDKHDQIKDDVGNTALIWAIVCGRLNIVRFLLLKSNCVKNVNEMSKDGDTALHWASNKGHVEMMNCLIRQNGAINIQNKYGWTALHHASLNGCLGAVSFLLGNNADPHIRNNFGKTALDEANQFGHRDVANAIQQHIQRQIQTLIQCQDSLPFSFWPNALSRIKSVRLSFGLVCEIPHLFQQVANEREEHQVPKFSVLHHPDCPACNNKKRKREEV